MATSRIADSVGRVLGDRYRLTRPLGVGASAHVFAAEDVRLRRRVAVKVLHPALASEEAFLRRFRREAQAVAALRHPNILRVYDWGEDGGSPYLVMELLEGGSLRSMLDRGARLSPSQAAVVGADAARALDYAHRQGLVHRDIKPANLLFDDEGRVSVADFGLARALAEATWTEPVGAVVGTARYASPELVRGEHLDSKADVYSLALVLVEAITGRVPFVADTAFGTLMARVGRSLEVSEEAGRLKPVLESAGAADPAARIDAAGLARALDAVSTQLPFPAPLPLAGPLESGLVERDDMSPTELPGRPKLFDRAEWEDDPAAAAVVARPGPPASPGGVPWTAPAPAPAPPTAPPPGPGGEAAPVPPDPDDEPGPGRRSRRRLRIVGPLLVAVLLLAAGGAAWALASGQLKPKEPVPDLVHRTRDGAEAAVLAEHLKIFFAPSVYSADVAAGSVVSQSPAPGTKLRQGQSVRVVLSSGPPPVPVPKLANDQLAVAQGILTNFGLKWTVQYVTSMTVAAGYVISSSPSTGQLFPGQSVQLVVSTGKPKVAVPAITTGTESFTQAQAALVQAGFTVAQSQQYSDTVPKGNVISVNPPPGTQATVGSTVSVVVSQGPHYAIVPQTKSDSVGAAAQLLQADGFTVAGVTGNPLGTVRGTNPAAGQQVLYGSAVVIIAR